VIRAVAPLFALGCALAAPAALAQTPASPPPGPPAHDHAAAPDAMDGMDMGDMAGMDMHAGHGAGQLGAYPMTRDASGTAWQPDSAAHDGLHLARGEWTLMAHGSATLVYDDQGGRRGDSQTFVESHLVLAASRPLAGGTLTLRGLLSLDPTIGKSGYPLLLQTGETANGVTRLIDRQHPHDFIGELAAVYSRPVAAGVSAFVYGGPAGEPALGPPVYLHRAVGLADPEAPITHHWLDSTHLAFGVVTAGVVAGAWKLEASRFTGREPNQNRWDLDHPRFDSWSARLSWNPARDWSLQVSRGRLRSPEQLEPDVDQDRTTASAIYNRAFAGGSWQTVLAWGRIDRRPRSGAGRGLDAALLESAFTRGRDTLFARVETADKDELFADDAPQAGRAYRVAKLSVGYQRSLPLADHLALDLGGLVSAYALPAALDAAYGKDPKSVMVFSRLRITG
jgi:hypothetical protein